MSDDDIHGLSGAYASDAVDDVERARFEAHMAGCAQCRDEVASLRAAANELTLVSVAAPPPSLRASVLREISSVRPLPPRVTPELEVSAPELEVSAPEVAAPAAAPPAPLAPPPIAPPTLESKRAERSRRAPLRQWLAGAAAAVVLATGGLVWHPWSADTRSIQLTATEQVLQAKDAQHFQGKLGNTTATIVRSASLKKAVIVTANLPNAPQGKTYELWLQQGPRMVRAGLMPAGPANTVLLQGDAASALAVGVTIEPAGGSDTPTLPTVGLISLA